MSFPINPINPINPQAFPTIVEKICAFAPDGLNAEQINQFAKPGNISKMLMMSQLDELWAAIHECNCVQSMMAAMYNILSHPMADAVRNQLAVRNQQLIVQVPVVKVEQPAPVKTAEPVAEPVAEPKPVKTAENDEVKAPKSYADASNTVAADATEEKGWSTVKKQRKQRKPTKKLQSGPPKADDFNPVNPNPNKAKSSTSAGYLLFDKPIISADKDFYAHNADEWTDPETDEVYKRPIRWWFVKDRSWTWRTRKSSPYEHTLMENHTWQHAEILENGERVPVSSKRMRWLLTPRPMRGDEPVA